MTGILGSVNLLNGPSQAIYINDKSAASVVTVNVCNRNTTRSALIRIAVSTTETPTDNDWIEYDIEVGPNGVLERSGVWVDSLEYVVVRSNMPNVNTMVWGISKGSTVVAPPLTAPTIGTVTWSTPASISGTAFANYRLDLAATDSNGGTIFYSLATGSSLPSGVGLSTTGVLSGTLPRSGSYSFTITASNGTNTANRAFTLTSNVPDYLTLNFTGISGTLSVTGNGTSSVNIFKTSGSAAWDAGAYTIQGFTAPLTLEFNKQAAATDNSQSYAMIALDTNPSVDVNFTSMDFASYPYLTNNYSVYDQGINVFAATAWSTANKFYLVFETDGTIKHYNGSTLLYTGTGTAGVTRYIDTSFYSTNGSPFSGFTNIRLRRATWNGTTYI